MFCTVYCPCSSLLLLLLNTYVYIYIHTFQLGFNLVSTDPHISNIQFITHRHRNERSERRSALNIHVFTYNQMHTDTPTRSCKPTGVHTHLYVSICRHMHRDTNTCKEKLQVLTRSLNRYALPVHLLRQAFLKVFFRCFCSALCWPSKLKPFFDALKNPPRGLPRTPL